MRSHDAALSAGRRALELNPSLAIAHHIYGIAQFWSGMPDEGGTSIIQAIRLSPNDIARPFFLSGLAFTYFSTRNYEKAIETIEHSIQALPDNPVAQRIYAAALAQSGKFDKAKLALDRTLELSPGLTIAKLRQSSPFRLDSDFEHLAEGLRKAGWSDG